MFPMVIDCYPKPMIEYAYITEMSEVIPETMSSEYILRWCIRVGAVIAFFLTLPPPITALVAG